MKIAFDSIVVLAHVIKIIQEHKISITDIQELNKNNNTRITVNNKLTKEFSVFHAIPQGDFCISYVITILIPYIYY